MSWEEEKEARLYDERRFKRKAGLMKAEIREIDDIIREGFDLRAAVEGDFFKSIRRKKEIVQFLQERIETMIAIADEEEGDMPEPYYNEPNTIRQR